MIAGWIRDADVVAVVLARTEHGEDALELSRYLRGRSGLGVTVDAVTAYGEVDAWSFDGRVLDLDLGAALVGALHLDPAALDDGHLRLPVEEPDAGLEPALVQLLGRSRRRET